MRAPALVALGGLALAAMSCAAAALITGFAVAADLGWVALLVAGIALAVLVIQQATRAIGKNKD